MAIIQIPQVPRFQPATVRGLSPAFLRGAKVFHWQCGVNSMVPRTVTPGNTAQPVVMTPGGLALTTGNTTQSSRFGTADMVGSSVVTLIALVRVDGTIGNNSGVFSCWSNTTATNFLHLGQVTGSTNFRFQVTRGGTNGFNDSSPGYADNKFHLLVGVAYPGSIAFYIDGVLIGTSATGTGSVADSGLFWQTGNYFSNDVNRFSNTTVAASVAIGRTVEQAEARALALNPWQMFDVLSIIIATAPPAGGAASLFNIMPAGLSNMGGSGAGSKANNGAGLGYMG